MTPPLRTFTVRGLLLATVVVAGLVALATRGATSPAVGSSAVTSSWIQADGKLPARRAVTRRDLATWCGTQATVDRLPQVSAGRSIHFVYAIPSDGSDNLASRWGTEIQTDAESLVNWWLREDPTRAPRLDTFDHPGCGEQLDLTLLRLPNTGAELDPIDRRADLILRALQAAGLSSPFQKLVVYYDGPDGQGRPTVCGQGGGYFALTYVNACEGVPNDGINAHEILHALGAVNEAAPNECPEPDGNHTCDTTTDIMYPFASDQALSALLLDPNRDDYYGHGGGWLDVQDAGWMRQLDRQVALNVVVSGQGSVRSDIEGAQCAASCASTWNQGEIVTLLATPAAGQAFRGWSGGGCTGTQTACVVRLDQAATVSAAFAPARFAVRLRVQGKGAITSLPKTVRCTSNCATTLPSFKEAVLIARASSGWQFKRWAGACKGTLDSCVVTPGGAIAVRAIFARSR